MRLNSLLLTVSSVQLSVVVGGEEVSFGEVDTLCLNLICLLFRNLVGTERGT